MGATPLVAFIYTFSFMYVSLLVCVLISSPLDPICRFVIEAFIDHVLSVETC